MFIYDNKNCIALYCTQGTRVQTQCRVELSCVWCGVCSSSSCDVSY